MLVKIFNLILVSLIAMLFFIVIQKPYELDFKNYKINFKNLEANNIVGLELDEKVLKKVSASYYYKKNKKDYFENFQMTWLDKSIKSDIAIKENENISLLNNVEYKDEKISLFTQAVNYSMQDNIISSNSDAKLFYNENTLNSKSVKYNIKNGNLLLEEVKLCIED